MLRRALAAAVVTSTVALALGAGPLATPAFAAAITGCSVDKAGGVNNGSETLTLDDATPGAITSGDVVKLEPSSDPTNQRVITGTTVPMSPPSLTSVQATFTFTAEALGTYNVVVYDGTTNNQKGTCGSGYTMTNSETLTVTSLSTPTRGAGSTTTGVTLGGTGFARGSAVQFQVGGVADPAVTWTTTATAAHTLTGTLAVGAGATLGAHTVVVTNTDTGVASLTGGLTVDAAPTISTVSPSALGQGASGKTLTVTGTGFASGASLALFTSGTSTPAPGVTLSSVSVDSPTQVTATVSASGTATTGALDVKVTNPDAGAKTAVGALTITPKPVVTGVVPRKRDQGTLSQDLAVTGTNFDTTGTKATFSFPADSGVTISQLSVTSSTAATVRVDVADTAALGDRVLTVTNPDGGTSSCSTCFGVSPKPVVTSVSPPSLARSAVQTVQVTGANFKSTIGSSNVDFGAGITVGSVSWVSATQLNVNLTVASNAVQGSRTVSVTNPADTTDGGGTGTNAGIFSVTAFTVTGASPDTEPNTGNATVTVSGSPFDTSTTPTVTLVPRGTVANVQGDVTATSVGSITTSSLSATFPLGAVTPGSYDLSVTYPNGDAGACTSCFTVTGGAPAVTSVSQATRGAGATNEVLTLTGTNFSHGSTVAFPNGVTVVGSPTVTSPTSITVTVNVPAGTTPGAANPTVTTFDQQSGGCASTCFSVTAAPVVTSTSPSALAQNTGPVTVTFTGTGFQAGQVPTLSLGSGVTATGVQVVSATSVTAQVSVASGAATGTRTVTATNPDHGTSTSGGVFSVNAPPTLTGLSETSRQARGTTTPITLTGTGFANGITVSFGPGITVGTATVTDANHLSVPVTVTAAATAGPRDVSVTNPDHGVATLAGAFTVVSDPTISSLTPSSVQLGRHALAVTVNGTSLVTGAALTLPAGVTLTSGSVPTANGAGTALSFLVDVASTATKGAGNVTVTNPDGGTVTKAGALTVANSRTFRVAVAGRPVSGVAQAVTVTAIDSDGSTTDASYTGVPALSTTDTHGTPGTCTAAASGVANCTGTTFADLGSETLTARGSGNDADLSGFTAVSVEPASLVFTSAPTTAGRGVTVSFTVDPTAANSGTVSGYQATRYLISPAGDSTPANGSVLTCAGSSCTFSVSWATGGTKSVQVTDGVVTSAPASVVVPFPTALSSRLNAPIVSQQGVSTLSGVLTNTQTGAPVGGAQVLIYRKSAPATSYTLVATVRTYSTGGFSYTASGLTRNTVLLAQYAGSAAYSGSKTARVVYVRAGLTASFPTSVRAGRSLTISGRTSPADPGARVYLLERRADGSTAVLASAYVSSYGTFALTRSAGLARGKHTVWVVVTSTALNYTNTTARYAITAS